MHQSFTEGAARISIQHLQTAVANSKASTRYYWLRDSCTAEQGRILMRLLTETAGQPDRAQRIDRAIDQMIVEELWRRLCVLPTVTERNNGSLHSV